MLTQSAVKLRPGGTPAGAAAEAGQGSGSHAAGTGIGSPVSRGDDRCGGENSSRGSGARQRGRLWRGGSCRPTGCGALEYFRTQAQMIPKLRAWDAGSTSPPGSNDRMGDRYAGVVCLRAKPISNAQAGGTCGQLRCSADGCEAGVVTGAEARPHRPMLIAFRGRNRLCWGRSCRMSCTGARAGRRRHG
jgi:hypothetical protein